MEYSRKEHYEIEKELSVRLKSASPEERRGLYSEVYDELFRRVPGHPMLRNKQDDGSRLDHVQGQLKLLKPYLNEHTNFLEIGAGDCKLVFAIAEIAESAKAVDVSREISQSERVPDNFELVITEGVELPIEDESVDIAYSDQLIEHIHPDDVEMHLDNVYRILVPRGIYLCITPSRISGPHDVSKYFSSHAEGMHLREYSFSDLRKKLNRAGFRRFKYVIGAKGFFSTVPVGLVELFERIVSRLPKRIAKLPVIRTLLSVRILAIKG
mgnify:CR=1 FL=1